MTVLLSFSPLDDLAVLIVGIFWIPLIAAGISAAGSIIGAKVASGAAKQAAQTQVGAVDRGIGAVTGAYQQGQAALQPYAAGGLEAYNLMRTLSGLGLPSVAGATPPSVTTLPSAVPRASGPIVASEFVHPRAAKYLASDDPAILDYVQTLKSLQAPPNQSSYVPMQAPDGSVQSVPPSQVGFYAARGARLLS